MLAALIGLFLCYSDMHAQEEKPKKFQVNGYVKQLTSVFNTSQSDDYALDILLHNRLNFDWFLSDQLTFKAGMRNRFFIGDQVKLTPNFGELIDSGANDWLDLSSTLSNGDQTVLHTYFDRFYAEYTTGQWEIRAGRQRINWGLATTWNPNDIFNAYAFTDFDYEERPGSDAIRIRKYYGFSSSVEAAFSPGRDFDNNTAALMWRFNRWTYDFQIIGGLHERDAILGIGWAGNIKTAGFKGEMSYFANRDGDRDAFSASINADYVFNSGLYWNLGVLYNSEGGTSNGFIQLANTTLSARNLYPYRWSIMSTQSGALSPLLNVALILVYSPVKSNALFVAPTLTYSIASNWDIDFVSQVLFESSGGKYSSPLQAYFLRIKNSF